MEIKTENDALFRLVHSMNRGEKKFFSMYCSRYENSPKGVAGTKEKSYLQLFNAINKQSTYDIDRLQKSFRGSQLHDARNYLYKLILEVLVHYNAKDKTLNDAFAEIEVLYKKKLYDQAGKLLFKIRKFAEEKNDFIRVLETLKFEKLLLIATNAPFNKKKLNIIQKQERYCMKMHQEIENYFQMYMELVDWWNRYDKVEAETDKKIFSKLAERPLFKNTDKPRCTMSKYFLHYTRFLYYDIRADNKPASNENSLLLKLLDDKPLFCAANPSFKGLALGNRIAILSNIGNYESVLQAMSKLEVYYLHDTSLTSKRWIFISQNSVLHMNINLGKKKESFELIDKMTSKIAGNGIISLEAENRFCFNVASACVLFDEPGKSMQWINKILNSAHQEKSTSTIYYYTRILELIALLNLKDFDSLEYKLKSFFRFSIKRDSSSQLDKAILAFIHKIIKDAQAYNKKRFLLMLTEFQDIVVKLFKNPLESQALQYFDFIGWLESKIQNKPYSEIVSLRNTKLKVDKRLSH